MIGAGVLSFLLWAHIDTTIIWSIVFLSGVLGFFQEFGAINALERLLSLVESKAIVIRSGEEIRISLNDVVPGDLAILRTGDLIPGDAILITSNNLFVDEAPLTGESGPVEKPEGEQDLLLFFPIPRSDASFLSSRFPSPFMAP